jgi:predicted XRE-type DNA-binding protein
MLNFVWDITLKGMNADQIRDWLRDNPPPQPGSQRAHNEQVTWQAVSPDLKATDFKSGFEMGKSFIMGAAGRPDSWFGSGGKMYQTEADSALQGPIADLEQRQEYLKYQIRTVIQFVIDQAFIHNKLNQAQTETAFTITMPEVSKKDVAKMGNVLPQLTTALTVAVSNKFIQRDTAIQLFTFVAGYLGYDIDAQTEIDAANELPDNATDYEALLKNGTTARTNMSRDKYIEQCKQRALKYLDAGKPDEAFVSLIKDLRDNKITQNHSGIKLGMAMSNCGFLSSADQMRKFIEGFN